MCDCSNEYTEFPAQTIGGAQGSYHVTSPVRSNEWIEYRVLAVSNANNQSAIVQVSGETAPSTLDTTGNSSYSGTTYIKGYVFPVYNQTVEIDSPFQRIANAEERVYVRVDGTSVLCFVTIQFRVKILQRVPAPFVTVRPEQEHEYHLERERRIQAATYGQEGEEIVYGKQPGQPNTVRKFITGKEPVGPGELYKQEQQRANGKRWW